MKKFHKMTAVILVAVMAMSMVACGEKEDTKKDDASSASTESTSSTSADSAETTGGIRELYNFNAEEKKQILFLGDRGGAAVMWKEGGHESDNCFLVTAREDAWHGFCLGLTEHDAIGKNVGVSFWLYHENENPISVGATLDVTKPDMEPDWPAETRVWGHDVPAGEWTKVEGVIGVFSDVVTAQIDFEGSDTSDFMIDDIVITVDDNSTVGPGYEDLAAGMVDFEGATVDFEDDNTYFTPRGETTLAIAGDAHGGSKALQVSGRTANWEGAELDLSGQGLAGKTIKVSCWMKADKATTLGVTMSEADAAQDTMYNSIARMEGVAAGEWVELTGELIVSDSTIFPILYFEAEDTTTNFYVDDVVITVS